MGLSLVPSVIAAAVIVRTTAGQLCVHCARHDRAARDHQPHHDRNQAETHDLLPWRVAEPVP
jgi:hypothetical protein